MWWWLGGRFQRIVGKQRGFQRRFLMCVGSLCRSCQSKAFQYFLACLQLLLGTPRRGEECNSERCFNRCGLQKRVWRESLWLLSIDALETLLLELCVRPS